MVNKKTFSVEIEGKPVEMAVLRPNTKALQDATLVYNREYRRAVETGSLIREKVVDIAREQKLWDDEKEKRYKELTTGIFADEKKIATGGCKLSEALEAAIRMRRARNEIRELLSKRNELDATTAEAFADQQRFNYLVSVCTVYGNTGKPYYKDAEDYLNRDNCPVAGPAAQHMANLYFGVDEDFAAKLPENKFLKKYGLCDEKLRLIRKSDGRLVDERGRLIDEEGRLVNDAGELIDTDGNLLTESGDYKVEFTEFEDDLGSASPPQKEEIEMVA